MKSALITGVAGQDGAYLARLLHDEGMRVIGTVPVPVADQEFVEAYLPSVDLRVVDLTDGAGMQALLAEARPDEIYNFASISSVGQSWGMPLKTAEINGVAVLGLLEAVRAVPGGYAPRICQASSGEMFGTPDQLPQDESTPIRPDNPYAVAKAFAHHSAVSYRHAYGMFVSNAILFNHESPLRPASFVTGKIAAGVAQIAAGRSDVLELGRLDIKRDWGAAPDYVRAMRAMLAADEPDDYIVATGESHELGEFVRMAFAAAGIDDPDPYVRSNPAFFRPTDIPETRGDPGKLERALGWSRRYTLEEIVAQMVQADLQRLASGRAHDPSLLDRAFG